MSQGIQRLQEWEAAGFPKVGTSLVDEFISDAKILLTAYRRLKRVEQDHINVLMAALYIEPDGIALVNRLVTYAIEQRKQP